MATGRFQRSVWLLALGLIMLSGWALATTAQAAVRYTVQPGDSLSRIALRIYGDAAAWTLIYEANRDRIATPDVIQVGQRFRIPNAAPDTVAGEAEQRGQVRVVTGDAYPPYAGRDLYRQGLTTEIVRRALDRAGYGLELSYQAWDTGYRATRAGEFDATYPYLPNERRRREFEGLLSEPLTTVLVRLFSRTDRPIRYSGDDDLQGLTTCRPHGYFRHDLAPLVDAGMVELQRSDSIAECFAALASGDIDFVAVNRFTAARGVRDAGLDAADFHMARRPFHRDELRLLVSPRNANAGELLSDFNEALAAMRRSGDLRALRSDHFSHYRETDRADPWTALYSDRARVPAQKTGAHDSENESAQQHSADETGDEAGAKSGDTEADTDSAAGAEQAGVAPGDPPLKLVSGPDYQPFADPELPHGGMTAEIVQRAAALMERDVVIEYQPWAQGLQAAADNQYDGTFPYVHTGYRRSRFAMSEALYSMPVMIFTQADSELRFAGLNDLRGTTVCKAQGYYRKDVEDLLAAGFTKLAEQPDLKGCFRELAEGAVDFVTANRYTGQAAIDQLAGHDGDDFRMLERPIAEVDLHLLIPESAPNTYSLITAFDDALGQLRTSGELQAIQERHIELYRSGGD